MAPAPDDVRSYKVSKLETPPGARLFVTAVILLGLLGAMGESTLLPNPAVAQPPADNGQQPLPPGNPRSLKAVVARDGIAVTWRAPATEGDAARTGYRLTLRSLGGEVLAEQLPGGRATSTVFAPPSAGRYRIWAQAVSAVGSSGGVSQLIQVVTAPSMVRDVSVAERQAGGLRVKWKPPSATGGAAITGYRITIDGDSRNVGSTRRELSVSDVGRGVHEIVVEAKNRIGFGPPATVELVNIVAPEPPRQVGSAVAGTSVTVTWRLPADLGGELVGYDVRLGDQTLTGNASASSITFEDVDAGDYNVRVRAKNRAGTSRWVAAPSVSVRRVPGRPGNVTVEVDEQRLRLSWTAPADDGNSPITGYRIRFGPIDEIVTGLSFVRDDVPSASGAVNVSAINGVGEGQAAFAGDAAIAREFEPFDNSSQFLGQVYGDFLGRSPDGAGLDFWLKRLGGANDMATVIDAVADAPEMNAERRIARLYLALFDRAPDRDGFDYWVDRFERGRSLPSIAEGFVNSPEFLARFGTLDNGEFVVLIYNRVLARQPDEAGFGHWLARLDAGVGRGELVSLFAESPEFVQLSSPAVDLIVIFDGLLQRPPQQAELTSGLARMAAAGSARPVIQAILASDEYRNRIDG